MAVKQNQEELLEQKKDEFLFSKTTTTDITIDGDHRRIGTRKCSVINEYVEMKEDKKWKKSYNSNKN